MKINFVENFDPANKNFINSPVIVAAALAASEAPTAHAARPTDALSKLRIVHVAGHVRFLNVLHMRLQLLLVRIHGHMLRVSFILLDGPSALLSVLNPVFKSVNVVLRCRRNLLFVHLVAIVARRLLLELSTHELPSVPVLLSTASLGFAAVHFQNVARHLGRLFTCQEDDNFGDLCCGA